MTRILPNLPLWCLLVFASLLAQQRLFAQVDNSTDVEFFESRIRPVLIEQCYECHNSASNAEAGLALDHRMALLRGGDSGPVISAADPHNSKLLAVLKHQIDGVEMPQNGPQLSEQVIADFERWITQGAIDPRDAPPSEHELAQATSWGAKLASRKRWWSFQPIKAPQQDPGIDALIRQRFAELQLQPAKSAEPVVLIRRLFITLVGLPPTSEELDEWLKRYESVDASAATTELVDDLLDSEHFGERWARHWMDWIRYAESHGSEGDPVIDNAWMYRDYLIRALNSDVPYDQLVREHIAGDLLPQPRINAELGINESIIGTAHWRMVFHGFAPTDALDEKVRFIDDQVSTFSKAFLGLTVSCARCHDHKFDAISQQDYYALFGILSSCRPARSIIDLPRDQQPEIQLGRLKQELRVALAQDWLSEVALLKDKLHKASGNRQADRPDSLLYPLQHLDVFTKRADPLEPADWNLGDQADYHQWYRFGAGLPEQPSPAGDFAIAHEGPHALAGIFPAGVVTHAISSKHPARLTSRDFPVSARSDVWVRAMGQAASLRYVVQDYPRNGTVYPVINLQPTWQWHKLSLAYWQGDSVHLELATGKDAPLLVNNQDRSWFAISEVRLTKPDTPPPADLVPYSDILSADGEAPENLDTAIGSYVTAISDAIGAWKQAAATASQARLLESCLSEGLLPNDLASLPTAQPIVEKYRQLEAELSIPTRVPGLDETAGRTQTLFVRGDQKQPAEVVPRRFLEAIDSTPYQTTGSGRLELAADLLRDDNPLTRRVIVNRVWHHLFGRGIVGTPDNLGRLGEQPTHPELLDYLAGQFSKHGWSLKSLIRQIVLSETWQQTSTPSADARERDADNRYLSHANVRRLEAESIRDSLLVASGLLDRSVYGNPVAGQSNRRSIYISVIRNDLDPFLRAFDFPEPFSSTGRRDVTNVPAQALAMMNSPQVTKVANLIAQTAHRESAADPLGQVFERLFARKPSTDERQSLRDYLNRTTKQIVDQRVRWRDLQTQVEQREKLVFSILDRARDRFASREVPSNETLIPPIARWEFETDFHDSVGELHGSARAGARIEAGALIADSKGYVVTAPLTRELREKTLEAWVQLDGLDQQGGGVISVQTLDGDVFDSIVYGEQQQQYWISGSDGFRRTSAFGGLKEQDAGRRPVHLAIVYHADGQITGYREGQPYGMAYQSRGPLEFKARESIVSFGVRHLPATGNRMLKGRIELAQLYDRALSADEIQASYEGSTNVVSRAALLAALSESDRKAVADGEQAIIELKTRIAALGLPETTQSDDELAWSDLVQALLTLKEFLYVR